MTVWKQPLVNSDSGEAASLLRSKDLGVMMISGLRGFILFFMFHFLRSFALKAQDRAIRAEEKLRYFILTGKAISNKITTRQFVGLRFASDEEFPALAEKAERENLSENDIKKAIINWKADEYRV